MIPGLRKARSLVLVGAIAAVFSVVAVGCARPPFTLAVLDRFRLTSTDLRHVQFFTSDEIVLRHELSLQEKANAGNELLMRDGVVVEEVTIPAKTPGVAIRVERGPDSPASTSDAAVDRGPEFLLVSFSREHPERALWFAVKQPRETVVPLDEKRFELVHLENQPGETGPFVPRYAKGFQIYYAGKPYQLTAASMWTVHLLFEERAFANQRIREEPPGWKLTDGVPPPAPSPSTTPPPQPPSP